MTTVRKRGNPDDPVTIHMQRTRHPYDKVTAPLSRSSKHFQERRKKVSKAPRAVNKSCVFLACVHPF